MKTKIILLNFIISLALISCAVKKNNIENNSKKISIKINSNKGIFKTNEWVKLYINFINESNRDITILKPSTEFGYQIDFFNSEVNCDGMSLMESPAIPVVERKENELIVIKAKSQIELLILGNLYELICNDGDWISIKIVYNTENLPEWIMEKYNQNQKDNIKNIYAKVTKLNIESLETKIDLD